MPPPILIEEIIKPAEQGRSGPYFCRGADGHNYFVKGRNTGRRSQITEWICAHLAKTLGLPVAPFALVEIAPDLLKETPKAMQEIGAGLYESLPEEWWWFDNERTVQTDFNWKVARALLQRCDSNDFWRVT